jgi:hypothetical protein
MAETLAPDLTAASPSPAVNPFTPPQPPAAETIAPPVMPDEAPSEPEKPKTAFVVVEPKETPIGAGVPPKKDAAKEPTAEEIEDEESDQIKRTGELTVVMVTTKGSAHGSNWNAIFLPKDATDLDVVEVHRNPESTGMDVAVYPNKDEAIGLSPVNDGSNPSKSSVGVGSAKAVSFRKMSKALWAVIS